MSAMEEYFIEKSNKIKSGAEWTLYIVYCTACNKYRTIHASPPAGPGGTLSCPVCRHRQENGPHIEGAYGNVKSKAITITLPDFKLD